MRKNGTVLGSDLGHRLHEFLMFALGIVDQRDGGRCDVGKHVDFARMVHAEFDRADPMVATQAQQRERQADRVVEIAMREKRVVAGMRDKNGAQHLRDGGLAVAASHRDQWQREPAPPGACKRAQRLSGVGDEQLPGQAKIA